MIRKPALSRSTKGNLRRRRSRRAMTLIEMLVAMVLSLIIILAVTQAFRLVGDNVLSGRAMAEMAGLLRATADQLRMDLDGVTASVRPWNDAKAGEGYFEVDEGPLWDLGLGLEAASSPPNPPADPLNPRPIRWFAHTSMGDFDDVLMFTARAKGTRFRGQILGTVTPSPAGGFIVDYTPGSSVRTVLESNVAEIAWFTRFNDWNRNGQPDPGEVTLHRRVFLVMPNLDITTDGDIQALTPGQFYHGFDISVRYQQVGGSWTRLPNSLESLALRENRTAHQIAGGWPVDSSGSMVSQAFPYRLSRALLVPQGTVITPGDDGDWGASGVNDDALGSTDDIGEAGQFGTDDLTQPIESVFSAGWATTLGESVGSDLVLANLTAFDVKVFDPGVVIQPAWEPPIPVSDPPTEAVLPGDPGYDATSTAAIGLGGYVDLFYARYLVNSLPASLPFPQTISSPFAGLPHARSGLLQSPAPIFWGRQSVATHPAVYDTWTLFYEQNGIDEDGILGIDTIAASLGSPLVDQGTNGADDDGVAGVDDAGERETAPPYETALRSVQVRIRIIEPDSRQVRQVTVTSDFIPQ